MTSEIVLIGFGFSDGEIALFAIFRLFRLGFFAPSHNIIPENKEKIKFLFANFQFSRPTETGETSFFCPQMTQMDTDNASGVKIDV